MKWADRTPLIQNVLEIEWLLAERLTMTADQAPIHEKAEKEFRKVAAAIPKKE